MAMLGEKKRKVRYCLNPRGNEWANDSNKYGQKILEKMGWTPGKGLGAEEQGVAEILRVTYKNDAKGLGFENKGEEWLKQQAEFGHLLAELSGSKDAINSVNLNKIEITQSLEEKSKKTRTRVHYHKFTRGKDLSTYSAKDLSSIVGIGSKLMEKETKPTDENPAYSVSSFSAFNCSRSPFCSDSEKTKETNIFESHKGFTAMKFISGGFQTSERKVDNLTRAEIADKCSEQSVVTKGQKCKRNNKGEIFCENDTAIDENAIRNRCESTEDSGENLDLVDVNMDDASGDENYKKKSVISNNKKRKKCKKDDAEEFIENENSHSGEIIVEREKRKKAKKKLKSRSNKNETKENDITAVNVEIDEGVQQNEFGSDNKIKEEPKDDGHNEPSELAEIDDKAEKKKKKKKKNKKQICDEGEIINGEEDSNRKSNKRLLDSEQPMDQRLFRKKKRKHKDK